MSGRDCLHSLGYLLKFWEVKGCLPPCRERRWKKGTTSRLLQVKMKRKTAYLEPKLPCLDKIYLFYV